MAKTPLKLFKIVRRLFEMIGVHPSQSNRSKSFNVQNVVILSITAVMSIVSFAFLLLKADNVADFGASFYAAITELAILLGFLSFVFKMQNIFEIIDKMERIIGTRMNDRISKTMYSNVNRKIERVSKIVYTILVKVNVALCNLPPLITTTVNYYINDLGDESYVLTSPIMLPFNWKTPFGYLIALLFETVAMFWVNLGSVPIGCFLLGTCWLTMAFVDDIINDISILNGYGKSMRDAWRVKPQLYFIVQNIADAKQIMDQLNSLYQFVTVCMLTWSLTTTSVLLFAIEKEQQVEGKTDANEVITVAIVALSAYLCMFAFCMFGENLAEQFNMLDDKLYQCSWYFFPIGIQRMLVTLMSNTQQKVAIIGYGNIECTRDTFKSVTQKICSYFMALRHMGE